MIDRPDNGRSRQREVAALNHASRLIHRICQIAGSATLIDDARASQAGGVCASDRTHLRAGGSHFLPAPEVNGTAAGELDRRWNEPLVVVHRIESEIAWIEDFHLEAVDHARYTKKAREKPRAFFISVEVGLC
jgi:hypothetical protein